MGKTLAGHVVWVLVGVLVALKAFQWGGGSPPGPDLDPGWEVVLEYAAAHRWQFATDLVFTYGPWGFLQGGHGVGEMDLARRLFAVFFAPLAGISVVGLLRPLPRWVSVPALLWLLLFGFFDHFVMLCMVYCGVVVERLPEKRVSVGAVLLLLSVAFLSHIKFTGFVTAATVIGLVTLLRFRSGNGWHSMVPLGIFLAGFVAFWLMAGQSPLLLPEYLSGRAQITSGYTEAMSLRPRPMVFYLAVGALLCFFGAVALRLVAARPASFLSVPPLMATVLCFLYWKHGFVRADEGHVLTFTLGLWPLFALLKPSPEDLKPEWSPKRFGIVFLSLWLLAAPLSLLSWRLSQNLSLKDRVMGSLQSVPDTVSRLPQLLEPFDARKARLTPQTIPTEIDLPETRRVVGEQPADIFYYRQGIALANRLNYRPRPIMQSYSAYTTGLAEQNARYLQRASLPYVLFRMETLDNRHPLLDDAPGVALLLHNYRPVHEEKGYLLLERARPQVEEPKWEEVATRKVGWGEKVSLAEWNRDPLWLKVRLQKSIPGKLRHQLYQLPEVHLKVYLTDKTEREYRFIPALGEPGLLINPILADHGDILKFWTGNFAARRVAAIEFWLPEAGRFWYSVPIEITLSRCPDLGQVPDGEKWRQRIETLRPPPLGFTPEEIESPFPTSETMLAGKPAFMLHPPGKMSTTVPANARRLRGFIGIVEGAYTGDTKTDGVTFGVAARGKDGKLRPLWKRTLQPATVPADRGAQPFEVVVDPARDTELVFSTDPGANYNNDWALWSQVKFSPN